MTFKASALLRAARLTAAAAGGAIALAGYSQSNYATPYAFSTLAGFAPGSADGTGAAARFNGPSGVAFDSSGNAYVADSQNDTIRMITPAGAVTTIAGAAGEVGSDDGPGNAARFSSPNGVAADGAGNIYVADFGNDTIRQLTRETVGGVTTWTTTTIAGTAGQPGSADGKGAAARFKTPAGVAADGSGNVYVADLGNSTIRKLTPSTVGGVTTWTTATIAGTAGQTGSTDSAKGAPLFDNPSGVAADSAGNVYVADLYNATIREIVPTTVGGVTTWTTTTIAGAAGKDGSANGTGAAAEFLEPSGVAVDGAGNLYVADFGNEIIRKITPKVSGQSVSWVVTTLAGTPSAKGSVNGLGAAALFYDPDGVAVNAAGTVYVADLLNDDIRSITPAGQVGTVAGIATIGNSDGTVANAQFDDPLGVAVDGAGNLYVVDTVNDTLRLITPAGAVATIAGSPGQVGSKDGTGSAGLFDKPSGIAVDGSGNLYVADTLNDTIRRISPATSNGVTTWTVATIAGTPGKPGSKDGTGGAALFSSPTGVAVDGLGNVYVADFYNNTIRRLVPTTSGGATTWAVTTIAGTAGKVGSADGTGGAALFDSPFGLTVDASGNVFVADTLNSTIRRLTPATSKGITSWTSTTVAGTAGAAGSSDGTGAAAQFNEPLDVAVDGFGNLYVVDNLNNTVRGITPAGVVTTLAGKAAAAGSVDGTGSAARFDSPTGVAIDGSGNLYVADSFNNTIRKGGLGEPTITGQPVSETVGAGGNASFSASATGIPAPSYQWEVSTNGGASWTALTDAGGVAGSATATLNLTGVSLGMSGYEYACVATNTLKSVATNDALLTVLPPQTAPSIGVQPSPETVAAGGNAVFAAVASGNPSPTFQWEVSTNGGASWTVLTDGGIVAGSATATLSLTGVTLGISGYEYECLAANGLGSVTTTPVALTVLPAQTAPSIGSQPVSESVAAGGNTSFTVAASGNPAPTFQWKVSINGGSSFANLTDGNGVAGSGTAALSLSGVSLGMSGYEYECVATNSVSSAATTPAVLTVLPPLTAPSIESQPGLETVGSGGNASFAVTTSGNPAPAFQWEVSTNGGTSFAPLSDGNGVAGSGTATLNLSGVSTAQSGTLYECVITNSVGSVTTTSAILTVLPGQTSPSIGAEPVPQTVAAGANASFAVAASGNPAPTYQWEVSINGGASFAPLSDGNGVAGSGTATLNLAGVEAGLNGNQYECAVTNSVGSVTSTEASLTVLAAKTPPSIGAQPLSATVAAGGNASFAVVVSGNPAPSCQWEVSTNGGASWTNLNDGNGVAGSATATLGLSGIALVMNGNEYECVAANSAGSATTQPAVLTVLPPQTAPSIGAEPASQTVAAGGNTSFTVAASGNPNPTFEWEVSTNGGTNFSALSDGNGVAGSATATLNLSGVAEGQSGTQYECLIANGVGTATTTPASLTVLAVKTTPSIATQPVSVAVAAGGNAGFTVVATGNPTPSYQWMISTNGGGAWTALVDGGGVAGSATAALSLTGVAIGISGYEYECVATNSAGSATTTPAVLTVLPAQTAPSIAGQPVTATVAAGSNTSFSVVATGNPSPTYQWMASIGGGAWTELEDGGGVAGSATATLNLSGVGIGLNGSQYECVVSNSVGSVETTPATLDVLPAQTAPVISSEPVSVTVASGGAAAFAVAASGNPTPSYRWMVSASGGTSWSALADGGGVAGSGTQTLTLTGVALGLSGNQYECVVTNSVNSATTTSAVLTVLPAQTAPSISNQPAPQTVVAGGNTSFTVVASGNPTPSYTWKVSTDGGQNFSALSDGNGVAGSATATLGLSGVSAGLNGGQFECVISNGVGTPVTSNAVSLTVETKPFITAQPGSLTEAAGGSATFTVSAGGSPAPTYRWQVSTNGGSGFAALVDGAGVSGSGTSTLSLTGLAAGLNGSEYECVATNAAGSTTSSVAVLSIDPAPTIGSQPASQSVNAGSNVVLAVAASGNSSLSYQWSHNGSVIPGATLATLALNDVQSANAGGYTVVVTDAYGSASTSQVATLTVVQAVVGGISNQPSSQSIAPGSTVVFTVDSGTSGGSSLAKPGGQSASLSSPTTYQWQFNGSNLADGSSISGATGPQLVITNATAADNGDYSCVVTTGGVSYQSNAAGLIVAQAPTPGFLVNISSRAFVGTGGNILIGGFYIGGSSSRSVLVQALGPALSNEGVPGALAHPSLKIFNSAGAVIYSDVGWGNSQVLLKAAAAAYAEPVLQPDSDDSEVLLTLPPGGYTAEVSGADGGTGVALCAIYQLP